MAYISVSDITQFDYYCNLYENAVNFTIYHLKLPASTINRPLLVSCSHLMCLMKETFPLKLKRRQLMALWHVSTHSANL